MKALIKLWAVRLLKCIVFLAFSSGVSILSYWKIYSSWSRRDIITLPVYFDFRGKESVANVSLLQDNSNSFYSLGRNLMSPKLKSSHSYGIQALFHVAKSSRNQELGKVTAVMNMVDSTGEVIDTSLRPLIVPYHSNVYLFLESIALFPLKFLNLDEHYQYQIVVLDLFSHFVERSSAYPSTAYIELVLSDSNTDILETYIIVSKKLSWVR